MQSRLLSLIILVLMWCSPIFGQTASCLDTFRDFDVFEPNVNLTDLYHGYQSTMAWYGECIIIGSSSGLWLYDPHQPDNGVQLARIKYKAIHKVAVNPENLTIAFNIAQESVVYLIHSDAEVSTVVADGQAVTDLTFSHDGSLIAVVSSDIVDYFYDARVQVLTSQGDIVSTIVSDTALAVITGVFFSSDNSHVLVQEVNPGYFGDEVKYWDINTTSLLWSYSDLLRDLEPRSLNDPLVVNSVTMRSNVIALGGVYGYYNDHNFYGLGVHLWDAEIYQRQLEIVVTSRTDEETIYILPNLLLAFDATGSILAVSTGGDTIQLWDANDGSQIGEYFIQAAQIRQISYSPNNELLAVLTDESVTILSTETMEEIASVKLFDIVTPDSE